MLRQMRTSAKWIWIVIFVAFVGGFLLFQSSGLGGRSVITPTTAVAKVNGQDILYTDWVTRYNNEVQSSQQRTGRSMSQDETRAVENNTFDQMVNEVLLEQEYKRRGIVVTDDELREYARFAPPPWLQSSPDLQTEGQFDIQKYQRLLTSPAARQQGLLLALENYYRTEIPRQKLFEQVSTGVYLSDVELWRMWQDSHDSAQVSYLVWHPQPTDADVKAVSDADAQAWFDKHKAMFARTGHAALSIVEIPRVVTAEDSAVVRDRANRLRAEIVGGAKFEDVAKRESADTISGALGGDLGKGGRNRFVPEFEKAEYALAPGEISQPVLTQFGYHLIRLDSRKGDTVSVHHILLKIAASDSNAAKVDRRADELAKLAGGSDQPAKFDAAARQLGLSIRHIQAVENQPATYGQQLVPSVSAWAFGGAKVGETSDLFDADYGYFMARLDTLVEGGEPTFEKSKDQAKLSVAIEHQLDKLARDAQGVSAAAATQGFEAAAKAANQVPQQTAAFTRIGYVAGLGQFTRPVGAAFGLPVGGISAPIKSEDGVYVLRVDRRVNADRAEFDKAKAGLRAQQVDQLRQQRLQNWLADLRKSAKITDNRKKLFNAARRSST